MEAKLRLDKWLWYARFFKTRALAARMISDGKVRIDGVHAKKPSQSITPGQTLTFPQGRIIRVVTITALATRRGPAPEAQALYDDLTPPPPPKEERAPAFKGKGRPTKRDRRTHDRVRNAHLEGDAGLGYAEPD
ncbi:RNA-binding S4 domain-containing protein [Pseudaestuariivita sp.]|uniref:RNA-binding S4 domain-containing protein n=1 Tax=Pseudaestuariivita sp. TaxID=2211669 RepID=UPI00405905D7